MLAVLLVPVSVEAKPKYVTGDINKDGVVNVQDLSILISSYNKDGKKCELKGYKCDLNNDKKINIIDLSILISNWTKK